MDRQRYLTSESRISDTICAVSWPACLRWSLNKGRLVVRDHHEQRLHASAKCFEALGIRKLFSFSLYHRKFQTTLVAGTGVLCKGSLAASCRQHIPPIHVSVRCVSHACGKKSLSCVNKGSCIDHFSGYSFLGKEDAIPCQVVPLRNKKIIGG